MLAGTAELKVSIPKRVSAKVKQAEKQARIRIKGFQSLKGYQPKWNVMFSPVDHSD